MKFCMKVEGSKADVVTFLFFLAHTVNIFVPGVPKNYFLRFGYQKTCLGGLITGKIIKKNFLMFFDLKRPNAGQKPTTGTPASSEYGKEPEKKFNFFFDLDQTRWGHRALAP